MPESQKEADFLLLAAELWQKFVKTHAELTV